MTVSEIMKKMVIYLDGSRHDVSHFLKVHAFARIIGECEGLEGETLETLEIAAIVHDIACPLCREKYGNTNGRKQEEEGMPLAREFLKDTGIPDGMLERVVYLVGHHHTLEGIDGKDYQILIEADYLVNADEGGRSRENIEDTLEHVFKTRTGRELLCSIYHLP